jgi:hypothetical protein
MVGCHTFLLFILIEIHKYPLHKIQKIVFGTITCCEYGRKSQRSNLAEKSHFLNPEGGDIVRFHWTLNKASRLAATARRIITPWTIKRPDSGKPTIFRKVKSMVITSQPRIVVTALPLPPPIAAPPTMTIVMASKCIPLPIDESQTRNVVTIRSVPTVAKTELKTKVIILTLFTRTPIRWQA